ncbi:hypothetical protein R1A27_17020 [Methylobacterium sp. NMS12]|uniref:hypothetical protein n=1 Tax=Methylobacterium sp. NMS12 TaxID=3079766 RepID=UPI003F885401
MSTRLNTLAARFAQAKATADASNARLRQASATRLAAILADPDPTRRITGLRDRALTPYDRAQLQQALAEQLPGRRRRLPLSLSHRLRAILRHAGYHRRALLRIVALLVPALTLAGLAHLHTPIGRPVSLGEAFLIDWRLPDGTSRREQEATGTRFVLLAQPDGGLALRRWFAGRGYGEVPVTPAFVRQSLYAAD